MTPAPASALILMALGLLLCAPWLEARRPLLLPGLLYGALVGWASGGAAADGWLDTATTSGLAALPAGWLALSAGASWDPASLRRTGSRWRAGLPALLPIVAGGTILASGAAEAPAAAALLAAVCLALDPAAAQRSLESVTRPGPGARRGPRFVSFWLGLALAFAALAAGLAPGRAGGSFSWWPVAASFLLGLCAGIAGIAMSRVSQGQALLLTVMAAIVVVVWIVCRWLGLSPLAALFTAGAVMARDAARRDLAGTVLGGMETPASVLLSIAAGAWAITAIPAAGSAPALLPAAAALGAAAPLAWRALAPAEMRPILPLPLSILAAALAIDAAGSGGIAVRAAALGSIVAVAAAEIVWLVGGARARKGGTARA